MQSRLDPEDIEHLIERIRVTIDAATRNGIELRSTALPAFAQKLQGEVFEHLGLHTLEDPTHDVDLEHEARICSYYAAGAAAFKEFTAGSDDDLSARWAHTLSEKLADTFTALAAVALVLSQADLPLRRFVSTQKTSLEWDSRPGTANELDVLYEATVQRYEQGNWKTAAQAARHITPEIVELAAELANRHAGTPVLKQGTGKPLEWIRRHRRSKV